MSSSSPVIIVDQLTKRYGNNTAVDGISFEVNRGEVFAFLGPNGAGKTTTVEILETIRKPTGGAVSVLGMDVTKRKRDVVRRIGVLPQNFASFERLTVRESIQYYARVFDAKPDIDALIDLAHLREKQHALVGSLSGGLKQRMGVAAALVNDPEIVFLDEPSAGLDPRARRAMWEVLVDLKSQGKTVFLTTHYMEEAEYLADRIAIIAKGRIIATGSPHDLIESHASEMCLTLKAVDPRSLDMIRNMNFAAECANGGDNIKVKVRDADDVQAILHAMKQSGLPLPGMDVRKPNLEEVFLSMTGRPLRDEDSADEVCP